VRSGSLFGFALLPALLLAAAALCGCRGGPAPKPAVPRSAPPSPEPGLAPLSPQPRPLPPPAPERKAPPPAPEPQRPPPPPPPPPRVPEAPRPPATPPTSPPPVQPPPKPPEPGKTPPLSEEEKIGRLIKLVADSKVSFIRNGKEHTPAEAADHLRTKRKYAGDKIRTARDFIEQLASKSSASGKPYLIRTAEGKEVPAGEWLSERLRALENAGAE
jgi:hypothetical protein